MVRAGDHYQVCELQEDDEGEIVGRVIANRIATIEDARLLASSRRALRVLQKVNNCGVFDYAHDMSDNEAFLAGVQAAEDELESHQLFITDYAKWQTRFGKVRERPLDDFLITAATAGDSRNDHPPRPDPPPATRPPAWHRGCAGPRLRLRHP